MKIDSHLPQSPYRPHITWFVELIIDHQKYALWLMAWDLIGLQNFSMAGAYYIDKLELTFYKQSGTAVLIPGDNYRCL